VANKIPKVNVPATIFLYVAVAILSFRLKQ
jgi:hypothetical protein